VALYYISHAACPSALPPPLLEPHHSASELLAAREAGAGPLAGLDGLSCARQLRGAGYSAAAAGDDERLSTWELKLADYNGGVAAGGAKQRSRTQEALNPRRQQRRSSGSGAAGLPSAAGNGGGAAVSTGAAAVSCVIADDADAVEYFRGGCKAVMGMRAERDITPLMLGTLLVS